MHKKHTHHFNALVLAAGQSSRMGTDKSQLRLPNGQTLLAHSQHLLQRLGPRRVLLNSKKASGSDAVQDIFAQQGPASGIHAALRAFPDYPLLVLPVDMPLIGQADLQQLVSGHAKNQQSCYFDEQCLPMYIAEPEKALAFLQQALSRKAAPSMWKLLRHLNAVSITAPNPDSFKNANNPNQWQECLQLLRND